MMPRGSTLVYTITEGLFRMLCGRQTCLLALRSSLRLSGLFLLVVYEYVKIKIMVGISFAENSCEWPMRN